MPSTRRALLGAAAGALATGLVGCNALSGEASSRSAPLDGDPVNDYEVARHVVDGERRLFRWTGDGDRSDERLLVATPDERAAVSFDTDGGPVSTFVGATDLESHSLALFQEHHDACRRIGAFGVAKRPDGVRVHICREPRPADEACAVDDRQSTALALRLPFDGRSLSDGLNVSRSSRCEDRFGPYRGEN